MKGRGCTGHWDTYFNFFPILVTTGTLILIFLENLELKNKFHREKIYKNIPIHI